MNKNDDYTQKHNLLEKPTEACIALVKNDELPMLNDMSDGNSGSPPETLSSQVNEQGRPTRGSIVNIVDQWIKLGLVLQDFKQKSRSDLNALHYQELASIFEGWREIGTKLFQSNNEELSYATEWSRAKIAGQFRALEQQSLK